MKPTVDLTEDRMFPDLKIPRGPDWILGNSEYNKTIKILNFTFRVPWEQDLLHFVTGDGEFVDWRFQIDGSAKDYRQREEWRKANSFEYCDRCGCRIVTPWRWDRSLCEECNVRLYNDLHYKKVPWDEDGWVTLDGRRLWLE